VLDDGTIILNNQDEKRGVFQEPTGRVIKDHRKRSQMGKERWLILGTPETIGSGLVFQNSTEERSARHRLKKILQHGLLLHTVKLGGYHLKQSFYIS